MTPTEYFSSMCNAHTMAVLGLNVVGGWVSSIYFLFLRRKWQLFTTHSGGCCMAVDVCVCVCVQLTDETSTLSNLVKYLLFLPPWPTDASQTYIRLLDRTQTPSRLCVSQSAFDLYVYERKRASRLSPASQYVCSAAKRC